MNDYPCRVSVDTHTHTVLSGHAWSTLAENVAAAAVAGLCGIAATDHAPGTPGGLHPLALLSLHMLPDHIGETRIFRGVEANIMNENGELDVEDNILSTLENVVAGLHTVCFRGTSDQNTAAYLAVMENPYIDIIAHPHQTSEPCDLEAVVSAAARRDKILELNASYLHPSRSDCLVLIRKQISLCKEHHVLVTVATDSHICTGVGKTEGMMELLAEQNFPLDQIINLTLEGYEARVKKRMAEKLSAFHRNSLPAYGRQ